MKTESLLRLALAGALGWMACTFPAHAAPAPTNTGYVPEEPEWVEETVPPPPAFSSAHLIAIEMPSYVSVKVAVDPDTIAVGGDGVVRYVVVMLNSSGSTSAYYEGLRCTTDEVKTYARLSAAGTWSMVDNPGWKAVSDNMPSRHAKALARQGACQNRLAPSKQEILAALKTTQRATGSHLRID